MRRYKFLVFTRPMDGREQEYDDWYQNVHLQDLVGVPGFKSAQRFRLKRIYQKPPSADAPSVHLAIYDIETDDLDGVLAGMKRLSGKVFISGALDLPASTSLFYEEYGAVVASPDP
jgi:hypothetical protein